MENKVYKRENQRALVKDYIFRQAAKNPDQIAFIKKEIKENKEKEAKENKNITYKNITYKDLKNMIINFGSYLIKNGYKRKKALIIGKNSFEWCLTYITLLSSNNISIPLDNGLKEIEIVNSINRVMPDIVFCDYAKYEILKKNLNQDVKIVLLDKNENNVDIDGVMDIVEKGSKLEEQDHENFEMLNINPDDVCVYLFTSGTTSNPKVVQITNRNITSNIYGMSQIIEINTKDRTLLLLPLHHTFGSTGVLFFLTCGATITFIDGIRYIKDNLNEYKPTIMFLVPAVLEMMYNKLVKALKKKKIYFLFKLMTIFSNFLRLFKIDIRRKIFRKLLQELGGNWRLSFVGASKMNKSLIKKFNEIGIDIYQGYGLSETAPVLTCESDFYTRIGSIGKPLNGVEITIDQPDESGIGEIVAKGPNVFKGYLDDEEKTKEVLKDGKFYTGDLGYIDKDGFLYITGRKKDMIVLKNGKKIFPSEIEEIILSKEYIKDAMVFGMPKDDDYELSVVVIYDKENLNIEYPNKTEDEINQMLWNDIKEINKTMPAYKYIKEAYVYDGEFQKTTTLKIKRFLEIDKIITKIKNKEIKGIKN